MDILLLLLRLGLAGVMALAGFAKLADLEGSRKAFEGFGVTGTLAKIGPLALSIVEITVAAMLLFTQTSWFAAIGALALLVLFIAQMGYQLAKGNSPDCHCFGQVYSAPVSETSVIRNVGFAIPAAVLVVRGQSGQGAAITDPGVNTLELAFGVVITALLVVALAYLRKIVQRQDEILKELEVMEIVARDGGTVERHEAGTPHDGLPIGAVVPDFAGKHLDGGDVSLGDLKAEGLPVLFMFVSPSCTPCKAMVGDLEKWIDDLSGKVKIAFVTSGAADDNREKFAALGDTMILQEAREVAGLFRAQWTPSAVLIDAKGRVASHIAAGDQAIRTMVEAIKSEDLKREGVHFTNGNGQGHSKAPIGQRVPDIRISDIRGREITSDYFKGKPTLVAFWSSACPHCHAMAAELRDWEKSKGTDDPNLIVFTEAADSLELDSPVIVDPGHKTATAFGMFGTPSAVLINENGVFVSETAIGAPDIWSLIGKKK
ncbi:MAG: TlpA family protein disulfide reductase [Pyrinomonadaceae bacterium]